MPGWFGSRALLWGRGGRVRRDPSLSRRRWTSLAFLASCCGQTNLVVGATEVANAHDLGSKELVQFAESHVAGRRIAARAPAHRGRRAVRRPGHAGVSRHEPARQGPGHRRRWRGCLGVACDPALPGGASWTWIVLAGRSGRAVLVGPVDGLVTDDLAAR